MLLARRILVGNLSERGQFHRLVYRLRLNLNFRRSIKLFFLRVSLSYIDWYSNEFPPIFSA